MNFDEVVSYLRKKNIFPGSLVTFSSDSRTFTFVGLTQESFSNTWLAVLDPTFCGSSPWIKIVTTHFSNIEAL